MTSSRAATRGMTFLPVVVAGATMRVVGRRQRHDQRRQRLGEHVLVGGAVGEQHLRDAVELGGGVGGGAGARAGDQHVHSPPSALAAVSALLVASLSAVLSCSAISRVVIRSSGQVID